MGNMNQHVSDTQPVVHQAVDNRTLAELLLHSRYFGAKSAGLPSCQVIAAESPYYLVQSVSPDGTTDRYQVVARPGVEADALPEYAEDYVRRLAQGTIPFGSLTRTQAPGPLFPDSFTARTLGVEQSNTPIVVSSTAEASAGDQSAERPVIVKFMRKLAEGINPEVELLSALTHCPVVPALRGYVTRLDETGSYVLATIQDFVPGSRDAWSVALESASFGDTAARIGTATRQMHTALREALGTQVVDAEKIAEQLAARARSLAAAVPELEPYLPRALALYESLSGEVELTRVHGDYHLGQVLCADEDVYIIDFEGEPARPVAERRLPDSPLRDVAGMIRSFGYAANFPDRTPATDAGTWVQKFLAAYGAEESPLLNAYIVDKALYEVAYEANNRPDWIQIPLSALKEILG